jgi:heme/copper-type cytochrome/quinol oxidase subunit 3
MSKIRLAMLVFIASESVFFILLILAYVVYHRIAANPGEAAHYLDILRTGIFSLCLLSSSLTVWLAGAAHDRDRRWATTGWLVATVLLGGAFLGGQATEYLQLLEQNVTISRDLFGTTFFTLTGFHGLHVTVGLVLLIVLTGAGLRRRQTLPPARGMEAISMYWHFVDAVWMVIFPTVYLWGRW